MKKQTPFFIQDYKKNFKNCHCRVPLINVSPIVILSVFSQFGNGLSSLTVN